MAAADQSELEPETTKIDIRKFINRNPALQAAMEKNKQQRIDERRAKEFAVDETELKKHQDTLAIGIFAHGEISINQDGKKNLLENNNFPIGVHIKKKNTSPYACVGVGFYPVLETLEARYSNYKKITKKIIYSKEINIPSYYKKKISDTSKYYNLYENHEGELFDGNTEYYEKSYDLNDSDAHALHAIILSTHDNEIDIATCSFYELCNFFKIKYPFISEEKGFDVDKYLVYIRSLKLDEQRALQHFALNIINKLITILSERRHRITTSFIFDLIAIARDHLGITKANILDLSCNVVKKITLHGLDASAEEKQSDLDDTCEGFSINGNCVRPIRAWGGKTKRKRKRKTKRKFL